MVGLRSGNIACNKRAIADSNEPFRNRFRIAITATAVWTRGKSADMRFGRDWDYG
ncbi:MAG: hypothetical protein ABSB26_09955 [Nitrososphaerales archaeon]